MVHVTKRESGGPSRLCKMALTVTLACLFVTVTAVRGDEPAAAPAESKFPPTPRFTGESEPPIEPAAAQGIAGGGSGNGFGFGGGGFGGAGSVAMGLPASAIPGRKWVAGTKVIVAFSDEGKQVFAYSEQHPRWAPQDLEPVEGTVAVPVVGADAAAVRYGNYFYAYSATLGTWDVLKIPPGEVAIPAVSDDGIGIHSASQGDFVFKNSWGKWFSTEEIKAGKVAELLQTRQAAVPDAQALVDPELQIGVFQLENIDATDAARILRQLYGEVLNPVVDVRTNSLVCKETPSALQKIEALLLQLDSTATKAIDLPTSAQPVDDLRQLDNELERRAQEMAAKLRGPAPNVAAFKQWNEELRATVSKAFDARQNLQRAELAEFSQRLKGIQQSIAMRDRISQQIIDRRVQELLDPNLKWDAPAIVGENQAPGVIVLRGQKDEVEAAADAIRALDKDAGTVDSSNGFPTEREGK